MHKIITVVILATSTMQLFCMQNQINISRLDKSKLLQELFYNAKPQAMGLSNYNPHHRLSFEEAQSILEHNNGRINILYGRSLKVDLSGKVLDARHFDHHNGRGRAQTVIRGLAFHTMIREKLDK